MALSQRLELGLGCMQAHSSGTQRLRARGSVAIIQVSELPRLQWTPSLRPTGTMGNGYLAGASQEDHGLLNVSLRRDDRTRNHWSVRPLVARSVKLKRTPPSPPPLSAVMDPP